MTIDEEIRAGRTELRMEIKEAYMPVLRLTRDDRVKEDDITLGALKAAQEALRAAYHHERVKGERAYEREKD